VYFSWRLRQLLSSPGWVRRMRSPLSSFFWDCGASHAVHGRPADTLELIPKSLVKKGLAPKIAKREKPSLTVEQARRLWDELKDSSTIRYRAF
jgi:hypothetical protein